MKTRLSALFVVLSLAFAVSCKADTFQFDDLAETIAVFMNGSPLIGNGGRISNFTLGAESVSFDVSTNGNNFITTAGFTNLLDLGENDDPRNTISDRFVASTVAGATTYHVAFGSDPQLPTIPAGARDLTTIPAQGLPPNPYYENGSYQKVGTVFANNGGVLDTFAARSDVPEPGTYALFASLSLTGAAFLRRRRSR